MTNSIYNIIFVLCILCQISILFVQFWNILNAGYKYDIKVSFMLFVGVVLAFGLLMLTTLHNVDTMYYSRIVLLMSWIFTINVMFFLAEIVFNLRLVSTNLIQARNSKEFYKNANS